MHETISALLSKISSSAEDESVWDDAILAIGFALEKSNVIQRGSFSYPSGQLDYSDYVPTELLGHKLDQNEQDEIVVTLLQIAASGLYNKPGIFWAIGKALSRTIIEHLPSFLAKHWNKLSDSTLRQALESLRGGLVYGREGPDPKIKASLSQNRLTDTLQIILQHGNSEYHEIAESALEMVKNYGELYSGP